MRSSEQTKKLIAALESAIEAKNSTETITALAELDKIVLMEFNFQNGLSLTDSSSKNIVPALRQNILALAIIHNSLPV